MTSVHYLWMNDSEDIWVSIKCNRDLVVWDPIREVVDHTDTPSTHRNTDTSSESTVQHNSRTLFAGRPPRSPQCTTSQYAPKLSSLLAGGDAKGRRRAPPLVTVHRRVAYTSHSMVSPACEEEAFEPAGFLVLPGIVAVGEQQRKSGSREMNRKSGMRVAQNLRYDESQNLRCDDSRISSSFQVHFRFFRYFLQVQKRDNHLFMDQVVCE